MGVLGAAEMSPMIRAPVSLNKNDTLDEFFSPRQPRVHDYPKILLEE
jgi:hypothetical protein